MTRPPVRRNSEGRSFTERFPFAGRFGAMPRRVPVPRHKPARIALGVALIVGGVFGFLPVLGFWMIPLGLYVLSRDFASVRRFRRRQTVRLGRWWQRRNAAV